MTIFFVGDESYEDTAWVVYIDPYFYDEYAKPSNVD